MTDIYIYPDGALILEVKENSHDNTDGRIKDVTHIDLYTRLDNGPRLRTITMNAFISDKHIKITQEELGDLMRILYEKLSEIQ